MGVAMRRAMAGVVSQPVTGTPGTLVFTDAFTGANGSALNGSYWTTGFGTGTAVINNNKARFTPSAGEWLARRYVNQLDNFDLVVTVTAVSDAWPRVGFRGAQTSLDFQNGYYLQITPTSLDLVKVVGWGYTTLRTVAKTHTTGTAYRVRLVADGASMRARSWAAAGSEPSSWEIDVSDATHTTGYVGLVVGAAVAGQVVDWDDITVTTIGTGGGSTGGGSTGGDGTGGNTTTARFGVWHNCFSGPYLRNYPAQVKANLTNVCLGMGQGNGTGDFNYAPYNGQSAADHAADVRAFVADGINVSIGVGGAGGGVRVLTQTHANQFVAAVQRVVAAYGVNGVNLDIETYEWDQVPLANACMQLRTMYGSGFQIEVTTSLYGDLQTKWMNFLNYLGHDNYNWTGPMLYDHTDFMGSLLTGAALGKCAAMAAANVPQPKMTLGFMLQPYPGYPASANVGYINDAYDACKAQYPAIGGMWEWDDTTDAARNWEFVLGAKSHV